MTLDLIALCRLLGGDFVKLRLVDGIEFDVLARLGQDGGLPTPVRMYDAGRETPILPQAGQYIKFSAASWAAILSNSAWSMA